MGFNTAIYFLKLGGSVITDKSKPYTERVNTIRRIFKEIKQARSESSFDLLIGHGGGSYPHTPAHKYKVNEGLIYKFSRKGASITHLAAQDLNRIVVSEGIKLGIDAFSFVPSSFALWHNGAAKSGYVAHIKEAMSRGFVPIVYGDAVIDEYKGVTIASTESVFEFLAKELNPARIILATDVDGVLDKDPITNKDAQLIHEINSRNINSVLRSAGASHTVDVTGGMFSKLKILYGIVRRTGTIGIIANGNRPGMIKKMLAMRTVKQGNYTIVRG
ncbi:MAG: isopentenyl phosphate kinase [Candidatus Micrarchaeaceae archaeon]